MNSILTNLTAFSVKLDTAVWGIPMLILLLGTGIFLSARLGFLQFRKFGTIMKNTVGKLFNGKSANKKGTLSPVQALTLHLREQSAPAISPAWQEPSPSAVRVRSSGCGLPPCLACAPNTQKSSSPFIIGKRTTKEILSAGRCTTSRTASAKNGNGFP